MYKLQVYLTPLTILLLTASNISFSQTEHQRRAIWDSFGKGVSIQEKTDIESILARPDDFDGRQVAIEGTVVGVCTMMGCWMELENAKGKKLRIKVKDGVIVFPKEAFGKHSIAQGTVERLTFSREEYMDYARYEAKERGRKFDPDSVEPPYELIQLRGSGALVQETP